jgi:transposase
LDVPRVLSAVTGAVIVALDVAKATFAAAVMLLTGELLRIVRFEHPMDTVTFLEFVEALRSKAGTVTVVMEPTGTYGDALRHQLHLRQFAVAMVQPKRTHDAMEVFDGVRSAHDNKDAVTLARLHLSGASAEWKPADEQRRSLRALFDRYLIHDAMSEMLFGNIEARLARHWPEFQRWLSVREHFSARALLSTFDSPQAVAARPDDARTLLLRASRNALSPELIEGVIESARSTLGVPMVGNEASILQAYATSLVEQLDARAALETQVEAMLSNDAQYLAMRGTIGPMAAAAIRAYLAPVSQYCCARAFLKGAGLNVREESSGTEKGQIHITKRGPSIVRKLLYMAALRTIRSDAIARAWYLGRNAVNQDRRTAAVVALMRKLLKGLFHVCKHNVPFNSQMLFDTRRLAVELPASKPNAQRIVRRTKPRSIARGGSRRARGTEQGGVSA